MCVSILVMGRFQDEIPEGFAELRWGRLMVMFFRSTFLSVEDRVSLFIVVEKKYPLRKGSTDENAELKLESEDRCTMALELIWLSRRYLQS
ncbi:hypothetical protein Tco_0835483 [Tanacetum coccineum]